MIIRLENNACELVGFLCNAFLPSACHDTCSMHVIIMAMQCDPCGLLAVLVRINNVIVFLVVHTTFRCNVQIWPLEPTENHMRFIQDTPANQRVNAIIYLCRSFFHPLHRITFLVRNQPLVLMTDVLRIIVSCTKQTLCSLARFFPVFFLVVFSPPLFFIFCRPN